MDGAERNGPGGRRRAGWRATKIVATIGPAAERPGALGKLLRAGVDVVRLNGAHCGPGDVRRRVALVRRAERRLGRPVGVLLDLGGPKIRLGVVAGGPLRVAPGQRVELAPRAAPGRSPDAAVRVHVTYGALLADLSPGAEVRIDDGKVRLRVERRSAGSLRTRVLVGGVLRTGAGVNFPDSALSAPALTPKDRRDLREGLGAGIDFVGLSFVRTAAHVAELRRALSRVPEKRRPWIVSKIERPEALAALAAIAGASDALMAARGDLGVEIGLAAVPAAQARILAAGEASAIPVIVATQMLESMIESPVPTRAEVSDVAGAVHGGADAVMLSGETAVGRFPLEAVRTMAEIARTAERSDEAPPRAWAGRTADVAAAVAEAAAAAARAAAADAIVVYTESGRTARLVSKLGLRVPIVAFSPDDRVRRKMSLLADVVSFRIPRVRSVEAMLRAGDRILSRLPALSGATVVEVSGAARAEGATNTVRIRRVPRRRPS
ncbi:MAG TPA: pyruvate kinase [Thermoanaerobaculia bacterium]|nr:pyruvate kinase [Thermoanaerobaculia bacterium]